MVSLEWLGVGFRCGNEINIGSLPLGRVWGDWIVENVIPDFREIKGTLARLDALDSARLVYWPKAGKGSASFKALSFFRKRACGH